MFSTNREDKLYQLLSKFYAKFLAKEIVLNITAPDNMKNSMKWPEGFI
jgi:hypothetical protein